MLEKVYNKIKQIIFIPEVSYKYFKILVIIACFLVSAHSFVKLSLLNFYTSENEALVLEKKQISNFKKYFPENYQISLKYKCDGEEITGDIKVNLTGYLSVKAGEYTVINCNKYFKSFVELKNYKHTSDIVTLVFLFILLLLYLSKNKKKSLNEDKIS